MAYTQSDLDALDARIATGELSWTVDGRSTQYRSLAEMQKVRAFIAAQLAASAGTQTTSPRYKVARFDD